MYNWCVFSFYRQDNEKTMKIYPNWQRGFVSCYCFLLLCRMECMHLWNSHLLPFSLRSWIHSRWIHWQYLIWGERCFPKVRGALGFSGSLTCPTRGRALPFENGKLSALLHQVVLSGHIRLFFKIMRSWCNSWCWNERRCWLPWIGAINRHTIW